VKENRNSRGQIRLDVLLSEQGEINSRSQAENYIKLGYVTANGKVVRKPGQKISKNSVVKITAPIRLVSRAGFKLFSVKDELGLNFAGKVVLDVGSSTGGFSDLALQHGAGKVIAVDVGRQQMDSQLKTNTKIELHEQTDIRSVKKLGSSPDIVLIDVSFISIREVLDHLPAIIDENCEIVAMVKPQFETGGVAAKHSGVIKNKTLRREILKKFERYAKRRYKIIKKADSKITGEKGNLERFYLLKLLGK